MNTLSRQKPGPWGGIRLRGVGPAQPAAALRQRMWRSRTELDRALDPDGLDRQVGEEVSGAGWRGRYSWLHPFRSGDTQQIERITDDNPAGGDKRQASARK